MLSRGGACGARANGVQSSSEIYIPRGAAKWVKGKSGEKVKRIEHDSGVKIYVGGKDKKDTEEVDPEDETPYLIELYGDAENKAYATELIKNSVKERVLHFESQFLGQC